MNSQEIVQVIPMLIKIFHQYSISKKNFFGTLRKRKVVSFQSFLSNDQHIQSCLIRWCSISGVRYFSFWMICLLIIYSIGQGWRTHGHKWYATKYFRYTMDHEMFFSEFIKIPICFVWKQFSLYSDKWKKIRDSNHMRKFPEGIWIISASPYQKLFSNDYFQCFQENGELAMVVQTPKPFHFLCQYKQS